LQATLARTHGEPLPNLSRAREPAAPTVSLVDWEPVTYYFDMTTENERHELPDWEQEECQRDIDWITEHMPLFWTAATSAFRGGGRGAIIVDTTSLAVEGMGHPFGYFLQATIEEIDDDNVKQTVRAYQPERECVIVLLKPENRANTYRVQAIPSVQRGRSRRR